MGFVMMSCRRAAELTCAALDRPLSLGDRVRLRMHLAVCASCKSFQKQNEALLHLFEQRFRNPAMFSEDATLPSLPPNTCERLKQRLQEASEPEPPSDESTRPPV